MRRTDPLLIFVLLFMTSIPSLYGQDRQVRLRLSYHDSDTASTLQARVTSRVDRRFEPVEDVTVLAWSGDQELGTGITNERGEVSFRLPDDLPDFMDFRAEVRENNGLSDASADLQVTRSRLTMETEESGDSVRNIRLRYMAASDSGWRPVPQTQVQFFVKRMFSLMPVGGDYNFTGEDGELTLEFPDDIHAGTDGRVTIVAQVADHDDYGTITRSVSEPWGVKAAGEVIEQRTLWASRSGAPWVLVVIANLLLGVVWGIIIYLVVQLVRIRKLAGGGHTTTEKNN